MGLLVRTWNLFHGRTSPPSRRTYLERMVRLVTEDAPDIVALQEVPLWALPRLPAWSGMTATGAMTMPSLLGPLSRLVTAIDPARFRSAFTGQANAVLLDPRFRVAGKRVQVLNPGMSLAGYVLRGGQRRVALSVEIEWEGAPFVVMNVHLSGNRRLARAELDRAAAGVAGGRCVLCGDFNIERRAVPDFSEPIEGIDQILVRGFELERPPTRWPGERRLVDGALLSDHAPVEAVIA